MFGRFAYPLASAALLLGDLLGCAPSPSSATSSYPASAPADADSSHVSQVLLVERLDPGSWYVELRDTSLESNPDGSTGENIGVIGFFETISEAPRGGTFVDYVFDRRVFQDWDSDQATAPSRLGEVFGPTLGRGVRLELDADGHAISLSGLASLIDSVRVGAGGGPDVEFYLSEFTDAELQRNLFEMRHVLFPRRIVSVGETWQATRRTAPLRGSLHKVYVVTLDRLESLDGRTLAHLRFTATATGPADATATIITVNELRTAGTAIIDVDAGRLIAYAEDAVMKFDQVISDTGETIERESQMHRTVAVVPAGQRTRRWPSPNARP